MRMAEKLLWKDIVRVHSSSRREFDQLLNQDAPADSTLVYVGERKAPSKVI